MILDGLHNTHVLNYTRNIFLKNLHTQTPDFQAYF